MIEMRGVSFQYADGTDGVFDLDLKIQEGECVVLTGPSGGGKTTITRVLNGLAPAYYPGIFNGEIWVDGQDTAKMPLWEIGRYAGSVFQDPKSQFFSSELAGEVAFACENYGMSREEILYRTEEAIRIFDLEGLCSRSLDVISSGEKQRTAIASIYALHPKIYVCDEPSANLDAEGAIQLAKVLEKLKAEGNTIIVAEHRLAWLSNVADRYLYVNDGRIVWDKTPAQIRSMTEEERKKWGLRTFLQSDKLKLGSPKAGREPVLGASNLCFRRKRKQIFRNINFSLWDTQITAITGANGIGKTSLALVLAGLKRETSGQIFLNGVPAYAAKRRSSIWYGSNDTGTQFFTNSVTEELLLNSKRSEEQLEVIRDLLKTLGLYKYKDAHPATLSGGQKQRLAIACGILSERKVLIFDEPSSGLDGGNMEIIAGILKQAAASGKAILVITHDPELMDVCCDSMIEIK